MRPIHFKKLQVITFNTYLKHFSGLHTYRTQIPYGIQVIDSLKHKVDHPHQSSLSR